VSIGDLVNLIQQGIFEILKVTAPILGAALIVGLIVAIFQATTSIQEQTLTFVPKLFAILGVLVLLGVWIFTSIEQYTIHLFEMIPNVAR
jgi:flagellar biosynthetic protein FliQ